MGTSTPFLAMTLVIASLGLMAPATHAAEITRVNVGPSGTEANFNSSHAAISADGRFVAFHSSATNLLVGNDSNSNFNDVFVHDRQTSTTTLVSVSTDGVQGDDASELPAISDDGRFVAFVSEATNLVAGDTNGERDVFVHDRQTGSTTRVSVDSAGVEGDDASGIFVVGPAISADGQIVAFDSDATNLVAGDTNGDRDVFVHDLQTGTTTRVSVTSGGQEADNFSQHAALSADGQLVAFSSRANNLVAGDTNNRADIFVRDRQAGTTTRVSVASDGTEAPGFHLSGGHDISADGRFVAFGSNADNLVAGDTNGRTDVFLHDRQTGTTTRVSVATGGQESDDSSFSPSLSADGRFVAFTSGANNLVASDTNDLQDIYLHDTQTGTTAWVSFATGGAQGDGSSFDAAIDGAGETVAFGSAASNLVANDTNTQQDIFVHGEPLPMDPVIVASVLPASRSVQVGTTATAFGVIVNAGNITATDCGIAAPIAPPVPATFFYQTTDPATNALTGTADTPIDIPAAGIQTFVFGFTPTEPIDPAEVSLTFACTNPTQATSIVGLNTLLLSADSAPVPDIIGLTTEVDLQATVGDTVLFAVGSANVGALGDITVSVDDGDNDLPLILNICLTDVSGACVGLPGPTDFLNYDAGATAAFAVFAEATGAIANNPANNRIFIRFTDAGGTIRGATSTAVRTQ